MPQHKTQQETPGYYQTYKTIPVPFQVKTGKTKVESQKIFPIKFYSHKGNAWWWMKVLRSRGALCYVSLNGWTVMVTEPVVDLCMS